MIELELTQGKVALIDDCDAWALDYKWYLSKQGYAVRTCYENGKQRTVRLHREILNAPKGVQVDHISGDTLDNRRRNLRLATHAENLRNQGPRSNNASGFKGVSICQGKWQASIWVNDKNIHLGRFTNQFDAALAYDEAARQYHGEFARTNFVEEHLCTS